MYIQSSRLGLLMVNKLIDPELKKLAANIPFRVIQARAANTAYKYFRAYNEFHY